MYHPVYCINPTLSAGDGPAQEQLLPEHVHHRELPGDDGGAGGGALRLPLLHPQEDQGGQRQAQRHLKPPGTKTHSNNKAVLTWILLIET